MDDDYSKRYENIDALIKAAEVLERNEISSKNQIIITDKKSMSKMFGNSVDINSQYCRKKLNYFKDIPINNKSTERFSDTLIQTINRIKELRNDERWFSFIKSKLKSDNQALYQELNYLKRKLNKMKQTKNFSATQRNKYNTVNFEDEDTSTASEDEDYNKYDCNKNTMEDNMDDVTDDASECEEISQISQKNQAYRLEHIVRNEKNRVSNLVLGKHSKKNNTFLCRDRKRKHNHDICCSRELLNIKSPYWKHSNNMTMSKALWNNCSIHNNKKNVKTISMSHQYGLIPTSNCEVSSKVHRIV